jgi:hypothetical protein
VDVSTDGVKYIDFKSSEGNIIGVKAEVTIKLSFDSCNGLLIFSSLFDV